MSRYRLPIAAAIALLVALLPSLAFATPCEPETTVSAADAFWGQSWYWMYLGAFGAGFLTSLTPCVYPMIPIVVGVFGARDDSVNRRQAFLLATMYVLGMGVLYSALGVVFALLGQQFGTVLANPWVVIPMVLFYAALAASMFGFWEIRLPMSVQNRLNRVGGKGYGGAFGMGLVGGITAAPCTGPILAGILAGVTQTQNVVAGSTLLFTYAIGMGVLFWMIAVFMVSLPKSGAWMESVKSIGGVALLAVGVYFLRPIVPAIGELTQPGLGFLIVSASVVVIGAAIGAIHLSFYGSIAIKLRKGLGILLMVAGLTGVVNSLLTPDNDVPWVKDEAAAFEQARAEGKGVMIDFGAEWCAPCKVLERIFGEQDVYDAIMADYVPLKFDVTEPSDENFDRQEKWGAPELPAVVFVSPTGQVVGRYKEKNPDKDSFVAALERANLALAGKCKKTRVADTEDASAGRAVGAPNEAEANDGAKDGNDADKPVQGSRPNPASRAADERDQTRSPVRPIAWHTDETSALAKARAEGKHVFIDFTAKWCAPCQEMDTETFSNAEVAALLTKRYVPVRIDLTDGTERHAALTEKYRADNLPLMLVLDARGVEKARIHKFVPPEEFVARLAAHR